MTDELRMRGVLCSASFMPSWVKPVGPTRAQAWRRCASGPHWAGRCGDQAEREIEAQGSPIYQVGR